MLWFMKQHCRFSIEEIENLTPFEFDLFYHMGVKDMKERNEQIEKQRQQLG